MYREKLETILTRQNAEEMAKWLNEKKNTDLNYVGLLTLTHEPFYECYDTVILNHRLVEFKSTELEFTEKKGPSRDDIIKLKEDFGFPESTGDLMSSHDVSVHSFSIGHIDAVIEWLENYIRI